MPFLQLKVCYVAFKFYKTSDIKSTVQLERVLCEDLQHVQRTAGSNAILRLIHENMCRKPYIHIFHNIIHVVLMK